MATIFGRYQSPFQIIRFLLLGIFIMIALLFSKYIYFPNKQVLNEHVKANQALETKKKELTDSIARYRAEAKLVVKKVDPKETVAPVGSVPMDQLLGNMFVIGDVEGVTLLRVKPEKVAEEMTPVAFTVQGSYWDTLKFIKQAVTLEGVGGISSVSIADSAWEVDRYIVTTTVTLSMNME